MEEAKRLLAAATARAEEAERTIKTLLANKATADVAAAAMDVANQELKDKLAASDKTLRDTRATCDGEVQAAQGQLSLEKRLVDELKQQLLTATQDLRQHVVDLEAKLAASVQRAADAEREKNKVWEDAQKLHAVIKTRDEEIAELKKRIDALQKQLQEAQDRLAAGSDGHAHLLKQIQVLETEKNALQLAVDMAKDQAASAAAAAQVKLADKDALVLELKREMGDVQRELQTAEAACKIEIAKLADKDTEIAALKKKLQQKEKAMADQVKKLADAEAQMQALNKTHAAALEALRDEIEAGVGRESSLKADWQISQKELIAAKKELDLALQSHHATRLQLDSDITQLKESLATQIEHAQEEEKLKKHWMSEKLSVDAALAEKVKEMQALQHSMAQLQQQIFDLNAALAQHKKQLESATASLEQLQQAKLEWEKTEALLLWQIEEVKKQLSKEEANHKSLMMPVDEKMAELRKWLDEALAHNTKLSLEKQQAEADEHATNQRLDAMSKVPFSSLFSSLLSALLFSLAVLRVLLSHRCCGATVSALGAWHAATMACPLLLPAACGRGKQRQQRRPRPTCAPASSLASTTPSPSCRRRFAPRLRLPLAFPRFPALSLLLLPSMCKRERGGRGGRGAGGERQRQRQRQRQRGMHGCKANHSSRGTSGTLILIAHVCTSGRGDSGAEKTAADGYHRVWQPGLCPLSASILHYITLHYIWQPGLCPLSSSSVQVLSLLLC